MSSHRAELVAAPRVQILCNASHALIIDETGFGFSRWRNLAVTRWREDPVGDSWGCYVLLRDETDGRVWSATKQPCGSEASEHSARLTPAQVAIVQRRAALTSTLEAAVAADRDLELRRVTLVNHGAQARDISLTSYTELVLGDARPTRRIRRSPSCSCRPNGSTTTACCLFGTLKSWMGSTHLLTKTLPAWVPSSVCTCWPTT